LKQIFHLLFLSTKVVNNIFSYISLYVEILLFLAT
jgi:hypothetical protein